MRKIIMGLGIALTALTLVATNPTSTEAKSKYLTAKEAGKKIAALQKRCYEKKIKSSTTFSFKAKNENKFWDFIQTAYVEAAKVQYGKGVYRKGFSAVSGCGESWSPHTYKKTGKSAYKYKLTINGKHNGFKKAYREADCHRKLILEIQKYTKGMSQFDKAWVTMVWINNRAYYKENCHDRIDMYKVYKRKYSGSCGEVAELYATFAKSAGVQHVGTVRHKNHMWNWIEVDGKKYYIDFQCSGACYGKDIKHCIKISLDPLCDSGWDCLYWLKKWCKEEENLDVEGYDNCKELWDSLTKEQQKAYEKTFSRGFTARTKYELTCDTYSKSFFQPKEVYCSYDHPLKTYKEWRHVEY